MKKVLITGPAKSDIIQIKDFMNNPTSYKNFINSLKNVFDMFLEFPNTGVKKPTSHNLNTK